MQGFGPGRAPGFQGPGHLADQRPLTTIPLQLQADEAADGSLPVANQTLGEFIEQPRIDGAGPVRSLHETGVAGHHRNTAETPGETARQLDCVQPSHRPAQQLTVRQPGGQALDLPVEILAPPAAPAMTGQIDRMERKLFADRIQQRVEHPRIESPAMEQDQYRAPAGIGRICHRPRQAAKVRLFESCRIVIVESPLLFAFILIAAAYLLGSFSSAIMLSRLMGFADPRSQGSRNPGATNVLRIAGKKAAALTLFGDLLKGLLPVLLARLLFDSDPIVAAVGFAAFIGHCYPLWYGFEGGKGVATAIGFLLGFDWMLGLIVVAIWLIVAKLFRLSSLAALIAFAALPALHALLDGDARVTALFILLDLILIWRHRSNIRRLIRGEEPASRIKPE